MQSRYYDPEVGRFINMDTYISNGQGFVGMNMFAYCINNPVNGCDPCGTCFHRWDFWNDCEKCGGKTLGEKIDETITTIREFHQKQNAIQNKIIQCQNELIKDGVSAAWDAYNSSVELENEVRYQQAVFFNEFVEDRFSTPEKTANTFAACALVLEGLALSTQAYPQVSTTFTVIAWIFGGLATVAAICGEE